MHVPRKPAEEQKRPEQLSNTSMLSNQHPFGSIEHTHETQDAGNQWRYGIAEKAEAQVLNPQMQGNADHAKPATHVVASATNHAAFDRSQGMSLDAQFAGLKASRAENPHQVNSQLYRDTAVTKKKTFPQQKLQG